MTEYQTIPAYSTSASPYDEYAYNPEQATSAAMRAYNNARDRSFSARGELSRQLEDIDPSTDFSYGPGALQYLSNVNNYLNTQDTGYNLTPMNLGTKVDRQTGAPMPMTNAQLDYYNQLPLEQQFYANFNYSGADSPEWDVGNLQFAPNQQYRIIDRSSGNVLYEGQGYEAGKEASRLANDLFTKNGKMADWSIEQGGPDGWFQRYEHKPETNPALMATLGIMGAMLAAGVLPGVIGGGAGAGGVAAAPGAAAGGAGAGGLGGLSSALSSAASSIGGAAGGLGGITVLAPAAGLSLPAAGGLLGMAGLAGLSQLGGASAATGASGAAGGAEAGAMPNDIVVTGAPSAGIGAETAGALTAATGAGAAASGAGGAASGEVIPEGTGPDITVNAPGSFVPPVLPPLAVTGAALPELVPNLSGLEGLANNLPDLEPTSGGNVIPAVAAGAGAAGVANAVGAANSGTAAGSTGGGLGLSDYLTLASLATGTLGNLFGGGGSGSNGTIPAGFGTGNNGIFNQPLPTLPSNSPFSPQNLGARPVSKTYNEWITGGYGSPTSYFNNVPLQSTPSVTEPYSKPASSVDIPTSATPTLKSLSVPKAPGADLLAAMLGNREEAPGMAHGGSFAVQGAGDGRSDSIDARLSDGEYVIDAETVALLGNGSTKAGADALDEFRVNIRKHKGKKLAKGDFSANAKRPEQYMPGGH